MAEDIAFAALDDAFSSFERSKIVLLPVPFDGTSLYQKGADKGPSAIIEASRFLDLYDIETGTEVYQKGIHTSSPVSGKSSEETVSLVKEKVSSFLEEGKFVVVLGGEHTAALGAMLAHPEDDDMTVIQLDAHLDLIDESNGDRFNHACGMSRAKERFDIIQAGIRSMDASEKDSVDESKVFYAKDMVGDSSWADRLISLSKKELYLIR